MAKFNRTRSVTALVPAKASPRTKAARSRRFADHRFLIEPLFASLTNPDHNWVARLNRAEYPPYKVHSFIFESAHVAVSVSVDADLDVRVRPIDLYIAGHDAAELRKVLANLAQAQGFVIDDAPRSQLVKRLLDGEMPFRVDLEPSVVTAADAWNMFEWARDNAKVWHLEGATAAWFDDEQVAAMFKVLFSRFTV